MKKLLATLAAAALLLSAGTVTALADTHPNKDVTVGGYATGDKESFRPVGNIKVQWVEDAASKINLTDGDVGEWSSYEPHLITPDNMISWYVGDSENYGKPNNGGEGVPDADMPANWSLTAYFLADPDNLYVGFYITDPDCVAGTDHYHTGDAFQINIDFGGKLGDLIENEPEIAILMENTQNVFYSFCYAGDGKPIKVWRDCSEDDRALTVDDGVKGATAKTEDGWSAEFVLPWQLMYNDYAEKGWLSNIEDTAIYIGGAEKTPLATGMALYYLNHSTNADGTVNVNDWTAGTGNGLLAANGAPAVSFDAYDNGITLILEADPDAGIHFTSSNIKVLLEDETEPPPAETTEPESVVVTDPVAESDSDSSSESATDTKSASSGTAATAEGEGCASLVALPALAVLTAAAAVVACKRRD